MAFEFAYQGLTSDYGGGNGKWKKKNFQCTDREDFIDIINDNNHAAFRCAFMECAFENEDFFNRYIKGKKNTIQKAFFDDFAKALFREHYSKKTDPRRHNTKITVESDTSGNALIIDGAGNPPLPADGCVSPCLIL